MNRPDIETRLRLLIDTSRHAFGCEHEVYQTAVIALLTGHHVDYNAVWEMFWSITPKEQAAFIEECQYRLSHAGAFGELGESELLLKSKLGELRDLAAWRGPRRPGFHLRLLPSHPQKQQESTGTPFSLISRLRIYIGSEKRYTGAQVL